PLDRAIANISLYDWLIFTSVNGVNCFFKRFCTLNHDIRDLAGIRICAIGLQTAKALQSMMLKVDYVPAEYQAEEIIKGLKDKITPGTRVLLPRADIARNVLPEGLAGLGLIVDEVIAYRTVTGQGNSQLIKQMLEEGEIDLITFTSSSTVQNFLSMLKTSDPVSLLANTRVACIGPITARTAMEMGLTVDIQAKEYTIKGLLEAIVKYYSQYH
ncbi:MAG TPA: uroporphyrinogen-III synthase, partial [Syntrophomonadaceae bacterium]|nr:uroporphyrinogen-III synthase [Syntrophomonadaceae bacterium]